MRLVSSRLQVAVLIAALAIVAGGIAAWFGGVRNQFLPKDFGVVEPGRIYRSGQISSRMLRKTIEQYHIAVVVDLSSPNEENPDALAEKRIDAEAGAQHLYFPLGGDGLGNPQRYVDAIDAILRANRAGHAALVHCQAGSERTGGVIAVYRILIEGKPESQAFAEMEKYGFSPARNRKLIPFLKEHLEQWRQELSAIDKPPAEPIAASQGRP
ncbi:MAG TPA: tyrosine-protein phosphatase [Tepidisphaeraceae bacterium]|jgi:protein-tyrosine phosphatase|nr:tyrosine-protein phosphatase [Tepidisphaeraceae bacterium]